MQCSVCDSEFEPTQPHRCLGTLGTHNAPQWTDHWPAFSERLQAKLAKGYIEYGDGSFDLPLTELVAELKAECEDISGWGLVLWSKLDRLEKLINGKPNP